MTTSLMMLSEQLCQGAWRTFNDANSVYYNSDLVFALCLLWEIELKSTLFMTDVRLADNNDAV